MTSFDLSSSNPIQGGTVPQSFDFDSSIMVPTPSTTTTTNQQVFNLSQNSVTYEDTLHTFLTEKDGNKYYKGFKRTYKSTNNEIVREQMFWIGDFIQFNIFVSQTEPPTIHEGKITSVYSCTFMGNIKKCKVQMLRSHEEVKSMMGVVGEDLMKKKDDFRRYMTDLEGEIPLNTITGRVFVVRDAKELKQRCGYYVENDDQVNTIDNDCYIEKLTNPLSQTNSQQQTNSVTIQSLTFSWAMKDYKSPPSNHYDYYSSCIIGSGSLLMLSVGNVCQLEIKIPQSQQLNVGAPTSKIIMGRVSKMFEDKTTLENLKYLSIEEISSHKKTPSLTFTGCVKNIPVTDILSIKKQL
ncbi:predicted protein [Naegleria gruberi]|uniref:Predicted protein n=1 Tax=Naegleria gruberi TaxID=5762 RepID=D2W3Y4_NAEGR|nr:uncharacterized protein NAEGRDRAFT_76110 [Naegleria gruberi]EFC36218.1 predicted protein [Naegleria gruberi]|eukprot:XP_002668962.1 predicted protein [Naegleria gruberi strain NEG-M]